MCKFINCEEWVWIVFWNLRLSRHREAIRDWSTRSWQLLIDNLCWPLKSGINRLMGTNSSYHPYMQVASSLWWVNTWKFASQTNSFNWWKFIPSHRPLVNQYPITTAIQTNRRFIIDKLPLHCLTAFRIPKDSQQFLVDFTTNGFTKIRFQRFLSSLTSDILSSGLNYFANEQWVVQ